MMATQIWKIPIAGLSVALTCGPASAFYFTGWPGAKIPAAPPSVVKPGSESPVIVHQTPPPKIPLVPPTTPFAPPPDLPPEQPPLEPPPTRPPEVPEPATITLAGLGLAVVAWKKRRARRG